MANFIQRIFIPPKKLYEFDKKTKIMKLAKSNQVISGSYVEKNGNVVRRFLVLAPTYYLCATRVYHKDKRTNKESIHYQLRVDGSTGVEYATHSDIDNFAKQVYHKMWRIWEKSKKNAKE